jgi:hypothetical protein
VVLADSKPLSNIFNPGSRVFEGLLTDGVGICTLKMSTSSSIWRSSETEEALLKRLGVRLLKYPPASTERFDCKPTL